MVVNIAVVRMRSEGPLTFELALEQIGSNFAMATGDLKNNLMKLLREIKRMKIELEPDIQGYDQQNHAKYFQMYM